MTAPAQPWSPALGRLGADAAARTAAVRNRTNPQPAALPSVAPNGPARPVVGVGNGPRSRAVGSTAVKRGALAAGGVTLLMTAGAGPLALAGVAAGAVIGIAALVLKAREALGRRREDQARRVANGPKRHGVAGALRRSGLLDSRNLLAGAAATAGLALAGVAAVFAIPIGLAAVGVAAMVRNRQRNRVQRGVGVPDRAARPATQQRVEPRSAATAANTGVQTSANGALPSFRAAITRAITETAQARLRARGFGAGQDQPAPQQTTQAKVAQASTRHRKQVGNPALSVAEIRQQLKAEATRVEATGNGSSAAPVIDLAAERALRRPGSAESVRQGPETSTSASPPAFRSQARLGLNRPGRGNSGATPQPVGSSRRASRRAS